MKISKVATMSVYPRLKNSDERGSEYRVNVEFNEYHINRETIVLLHGYMGSIEDYDPAFDKLGEKYNLIAVDLRAHGSSTYPDDKDVSWYISDLAEDVIQVIDYIAPESSFSIVASSMSTAIALEMAKLYPEVVRRLFLMSPTSKFTIPNWVKLIFGLGKISTTKFMEGLVDTIGTVMTKMASPQEKEFWKKGVEKFEKIDFDIHKKIFTETLPSWEFTDFQSDVPIFIVAGLDDNVVPYQDSLALVDTLPNASLLSLKDTKHHIILDRSDLIYDLIEQWMEETDELLQQQKYFDEHIVEELDNHYHLMKDQLVTKKRPEVEI